MSRRNVRKLSQESVANGNGTGAVELMVSDEEYVKKPAKRIQQTRKKAVIDDDDIYDLDSVILEDSDGDSEAKIPPSDIHSPILVEDDDIEFVAMTANEERDDEEEEEDTPISKYNLRRLQEGIPEWDNVLKDLSKRRQQHNTTRSRLKSAPKRGEDVDDRRLGVVRDDSDVAELPDTYTEEEEEYVLPKRRSKRKAKVAPKPATPKSSTPKKSTNKYLTKEKLSDDDFEMDDNDFVVDDDKVEYESEDEREEDEGEGDGEGFSHAAFDNERTLREINEEIEDGTLGLLPTARPDLGSAFVIWLKYLCSVIIDGDFSRWAYSTPSLRSRILPAIDVIESKFKLQREQWVRSQLWTASGRTEFDLALRSLPYLRSEMISGIDPETGQRRERQCQACNKQHAVTNKVTFFGIPYNSNKLGYPWKISEIYRDSDSDYTSCDFVMGELCHKRVVLYHVMLHYRLHVMLTLRKFLEDKAGAIPHNVKHNSNVVKVLFTEPLSNEFKKVLDFWQDWYTELMHLSEQYVQGDTRAVKFDVHGLIEDSDRFEIEACFLELFSLRSTENSSTNDNESASSSWKKSSVAKPSEKGHTENDQNGSKHVDPRSPKMLVFDIDDSEDLEDKPEPEPLSKKRKRLSQQHKEADPVSNRLAQITEFATTATPNDLKAFLLLLTASQRQTLEMLLLESSS